MASKTTKIFAHCVLLTCLIPAVLQTFWPQHAISPRDIVASWYTTPLAIALSGLCLLFALGGCSGVARWFLAPLALLAPVEALYVWHFGVPSGPHVYAVIAESNMEEVSTWIGADWPQFVALGLLWILVIAWATWRWQGPAWALGQRQRLVLALLGLSLLLPQGLATALANPLDELLAQSDATTYVQQPVVPPDSGFALFVERTYPWGVPQRLLSWREHRAVARLHAEVAATHRFRLSSAEQKDPSQQLIVVMVIGESSRADRWSLYGFERETTPLLLNLRSELLVFKDAAAAASATREAITLMLTRRPPEQPLGTRSEGSVVSAFRQAGFKTYWLSTQGSAGAHETPVAVMANEAHERRYLSHTDYRGRTALDGELLEPLREVLNRREPQVFVVLHTLGSHLHYANRYPDGREPFQPALKRHQAPNIWRKERLEELVNAYDNSIHYTDWVLHEVIRLLKDTDALVHMSFMSDHGETLFDGQCPRGGHGFASIANYHVPLVMWASEAWRNRFAQRWELLTRRQDAPVSALAVFPTLLGHAGLQLLDGVSHQDLGNENWRPAPRPVAHFGDFDRDIAAKACDAPVATSSARSAGDQNVGGRLGSRASRAP